MNSTILVFSDSHGVSRDMQKVIDSYKNGYECVFFLGDGLRDAEKLVIPSEKGRVFVRGNCDFYSDEPLFAVINVGGYDFMLAHGHSYGVKSGLSGYAAAARERKVDAALFGHTHVPFEDCLTDGEKPLYLFNPGSISCPARGKASFGVITVSPQGIVFSHGDPSEIDG